MMRTLACGNPTQVTKAAPCAFRQNRQWQCPHQSEGAAAMKRRAPNMHWPANSLIASSGKLKVTDLWVLSGGFGRRKVLGCLDESHSYPGHRMPEHAVDDVLEA